MPRMRSAAPRHLLRSTIAMVVLALIGLTAGPVTSARAAAPSVADGHGITVVGQKQLTDRTFELELASDLIDPAVTTDGLKVRVTLPTSYRKGRTYPVLYLLHGVDRSYRTWTEAGDLENVTADQDLIIVTPEGGRAGWYSDWINQAQHTQNWESFHLEQLIPFIDDNLPTKADKAHRGIGGFSMGGFGAMHYATHHPELFSYAASFSGAVDLENQAIRFGVLSSVSLQKLGHPYDVFGDVVWPNDTNWIRHNPVRNAAALEGMTVSLYAGGDIFDPLESNVGWSSHTMSGALARAGIPHVWDMYGQPGTLEGYPCDGGHDAGCWSGALKRELPRIDSALGT